MSLEGGIQKLLGMIPAPHPDSHMLGGATKNATGGATTFPIDNANSNFDFMMMRRSSARSGGSSDGTMGPTNQNNILGL